MVTLASQVEIPKDVLFRDLGSEAIVLNVRTGVYYGLNDTGTRMWNVLSQHAGVEQAYRMLLAEYDVANDRLRHDLLELIGQLAERGLVDVHEHLLTDPAEG